jgi:hypothetical protein
VKRILKPISYVLAAIYFCADFIFAGMALPISSWLRRHFELRRLRVLIRSLPPYPCLALFSVPVILLEPVKFLAAYGCNGPANRGTRGLLTEAEPRDFWKQLGASSRSDLEALSHNLKTAESNAKTLETRYLSLVKDGRDKVEHDASVLAGRTNILAKFMALIDEQHADMKSLISRISAERLEYSAAYEKCVALLMREFGLYKVVNGQIIFQLQPTEDSFNEAAGKMAAAASRLEQLDGERTTLKQSQLERWKNLGSP